MKKKDTVQRYKIEEGIPVPKPWGGGSKYPFHGMNVGDSFFIEKSDIQISRVRSAAAFYGVRHGKKLSVRSFPDGLRVWRVK